MVVNAKRKRKESPLPAQSAQQQQPPQQQQQAPTESPEMPKRTKVQAQRKFAQGQSAPTSSYAAIMTAATSSNAGPSTSAESRREPPTELLPNKRPKTDDFITFLCFRNSSALPAHLNYMNQGKTKEAETSVKKISNKPQKVIKKAKKGKPKSSKVAPNEPKASTSAHAAASVEVVQDAMQEKPKECLKDKVDNIKEKPSDKVLKNIDKNESKNSEIKTEIRRGRPPKNVADNEILNSPETKRRSNRTSAKDVRSMVEPDTEDEDEYLSVPEVVAKIEEIEQSKFKERKSQTPCIELQESNSKTKKIKVTENENKNNPKLENNAVKEKLPPKRSRQKESPIFIPSPEPSGRMTRQRAFFEPVKVPHREENNEELVKESEKKENKKPENEQKTEELSEKDKLDIKANKQKDNTHEKIMNNDKDKDKNTTKSNLNVFDFSSDDEQPLSKAIKFKKGKASPKKINSRGRKPTPKKVADENDKPLTENIKKSEEGAKATVEIPAKIDEPTNASKQLKAENESSNKKGRAVKAKLQEPEDAKIIDVEKQEKKPTNARQARKKLKEEQIEIETEKDNSPSPIRSQRPSRKTKEAATIYMGIIGHKLQLADDEDDDLSLNSFPELPCVKEVEKMEMELKKNAAQMLKNEASDSITTAALKTVNTETASLEKPVTSGRRGRPPKTKKDVATAELLKKSNEIKEKIDHHSDEEDFLLNEQVKETKRKLEKSFSDSDDEPLAIKAHVKSEKDVDFNTTPPKSNANNSRNSNQTLPLTSKPIRGTPPLPGNSLATNNSPILTQHSSPTIQSPFKHQSEKKSPVPTTKIANVPATFGTPSTQPSNIAASNYNKQAASYLAGQTVATHYHNQLNRPAVHQFPSAKSPNVPMTSASGIPPHHHTMTGPGAPPPHQSPLKYQTPPATYPPPIDAYPSPKINPNFLTPKFDRSSLPRSNNFPSPSPVKFDISSGTSKAAGMTFNSSFSPKTPNMPCPSNNASNSATKTTNDSHKDEIAAILAADLMPSKEESGKIFGIASVSLAQSSGPDNTKCTLGKCGSIHKPVLGPVVPTEGYIGDQLSSKERRKAKVNMTHEQIQKWLIECSSNPDEILDDLEDDFDDNLRPNLFATTPPPTRDDKESTSFSSSSKATRDLGKSESAWSAKGPSLKATPVVAAVASNRKDDNSKELANSSLFAETTAENEKPAATSMHKPTATAKRAAAAAKNETKHHSDKIEKNADKKSHKEDKLSAAKEAVHSSSAHKTQKESLASSKANSKQASNAAAQESPTTNTPKGRKKNTMSNSSIGTPAAQDKATTGLAKNTSSPISPPPTLNKTPKRTPVYNQKKQMEPETSTSPTKTDKKTLSYSAFSVENEKSIYSFDKDEDDDADGTTKANKPAYKRQSRRDSNVADESATTPTSRNSPNKKRAAAAAAEKANKDLATSSVSLTLSPSEKNKLVKVCLDAEKSGGVTKSAAGKGGKGSKKATANDEDSDSEGHTFYIPLQGSGSGNESEGGIQGVAVKLGREGPDGPNQKVVMHATLVTKAQIGSNSKPIPDSLNVLDIVKNLMSAAGGDAAISKKLSTNSPSTSAAAAAAAAGNSSSNSLKNVPIGTVQPRFKPAEATAAAVASTSANHGSGRLIRVNSNSSLFSGSAKSRTGAAPVGAPATTAVSKKFKDDTPIKMANNTAFPRVDDPTQMVEAPIFRPTEKEFADPMEFIERITPIAARFGICKIIPPSTFKPECRISDEMRFTAYNQYIHKMLHRWGPSAKEFCAIKKYLATQSIVMNHPPWIGGMEVDLPRLYHTVQELGGLKEVIEKKKWARVAEEMCIPKLAQDRVTKLDDIYCKYLLPYDTLSPAERQKLFDEVEADWAKREARARRNADRFVNTESVSNEEDEISSEDEEESEEEVDTVSMECIVKGRSMPLSQFYRIARNTLALWFKNTEPTVTEVEAEFWRHVAVRDSHVCVHSGSIDSSGWGYGFPSPGPKGKGSNYARHPWNLKVLTNNPGSVLRSLGPVMGVTVPTLHVGMLFSACCWYRDPHGLSWIEYLHTGASKLWYGIPDDQSANFRSALTSLIPTHCQNKTIWLPCDTVMVPPHMLTDRGVSLCRIEQKPGEFIVVFPRAYTSSLATGYVVSESVYFATNSWLDLAKDDFRDIHDSCEPAMFSLEQLLFALGHDQRVTSDTLQQMLPMLHEVFDKELAAREQLKAGGVTSSEKVLNEKQGAKTKKLQQPPPKSIESECDLCRANLYISMVRTDEGNVYCLQHALKNLNNGNIQAKQCKLIYAYNVEDIENLIKSLKEKIQQKRLTTVSNKKK